ncbi:MAG: amidase, partial [Pseudomonadota bacterium]
GPMTRTVGDAALMFSAIVGQDPADPWSIALPADAQQQGLVPVSVDGLRLGVVRRHFFAGDANVIGVVDQAIEQLVAKGATTVALDVPDIEAAYAACRRVFLEAGALHADALQARPDDFSNPLRQKLIAATQISGQDYARDQDYRHAFRTRMDQLLDQCDVLVTPTACVPTPEIDSLGEAFFSGSPRNTNISDFTGQPSISVPCGFDHNAMPVGIMLTGRRFSDWRLLSQARAIEGVLGVFDQPPGY